jgi:hypothetical protein
MITAFALSALSVGCHKLNKNKEAPVESKQPITAKAEAKPIPTHTDAEWLKMFHTSAYCGTNPCPELDAINALAKSAPDHLGMIALEVMADPEARTDQGAGQQAMLYVDDWMRKGPPEALKPDISKALEKIAANGSELMQSGAYAMLAEYRLPDAKRIVMEAIENPSTSESDRGGLGNPLGVLLDDFDLIRQWLKEEKPFHWHAALNMMKNFKRDDAEARVQRWEEQRALLIGLAQRPVLPAGVVEELAFWFDIYLDDNRNDTEILKLTERWTKHPDDMAAGQMRKILTWYTSMSQKQKPK